MQKTLEFYANKSSYGSETGSIMPIKSDQGWLAQNTLNRVRDLLELNRKGQEDYEKLVAGYQTLQATEDVVDPKKLLEVFKVISNGDQNIQ
jgi:hypothetical protein